MGKEIGTAPARFIPLGKPALRTDDGEDPRASDLVSRLAKQLDPKDPNDSNIAVKIGHESGHDVVHVNIGEAPAGLALRIYPNRTCWANCPDIDAQAGLHGEDWKRLNSEGPDMALTVDRMVREKIWGCSS